VIDSAPVSPVFEVNSQKPSVERSKSATDIVAVPVRVQAEPEPEPALSTGAADGADLAAVPADVRADNDGDFWYALVRQLISAEAVSALTRELALQSQLVARDGEDWLLRIERESLNQPAARDRLQQALKAAGHLARLAIEVGRVTDSPGRRNAQAVAEKMREAEAVIQADPFVQAMMRDFGAKIVPGSIKPV